MLGTAALACTAVPPGALPHGSDDLRAAQVETEVDLASVIAYGERHPDCLAWSDWSRTCSRLTGDGANVHCNDSEEPVESSEPFCLAVREETRSTARMSGQATAATSYDGFCRSKRMVNGESRCFERDADRPFGGLRISELRHPFCEVWGNDDGPFCTEGPGSTNLPSCEQMEQAPKASSPLSCFQPSSQKMGEFGCRKLTYPRTKRSPIYVSDGQIIPILEDAPESPVANVYCREWSI